MELAHKTYRRFFIWSFSSWSALTVKDSFHIWLEILRAGFSRKLPDDPISGVHSESRGVNLGLMQPYFMRHWKKGFAGVIAILFTALLAFPVPLITRFLVDDVILGKHLGWLIWAVLALAGVKGLSIAASMAEKYVFSRFQMDITLDLQHNLLDHTLQLPKSFFDDKEVGYLMSRLVSDVDGLNWFFSQTIAYFLSNILSFIGGIVFLFILEWRLALVNLFVLPLLIISGNAFSKRMRVLGHHSMEQHANFYTSFQ
jgi:ABC-type bacteriocin/lantibiotic exporter with double-glycine peptidase domain